MPSSSREPGARPAEGLDRPHSSPASSWAAEFTERWFTFISLDAGLAGATNLYRLESNVTLGYAFIDGRGYVTPDDVKAVARDVLRHRIIITYEAEAEGLSSDDVVDRVLQGVAVP